MSTLRTRAAKGSELTHAELDANFKRIVSAKTSAYSCLISDNRNWIVGNHATTPFVITLGDAATMAASETGDYEVTIHNVGAAVVTVSRAGTDTIDGAATSIALNQYESVTLKVNATNNGYESIARGLGGLTSTVAELNILDGVTATTSELNYVDGVTSSIQTQIDGAVKIAGAQTITGAKTFTNAVTVEGDGPLIKLSDTTAAADDFWVHANSDIFYVLTDRNDDGAWETPHPLELNNTTSVGSLYGSPIITSASIGSQTAGAITSQGTLATMNAVGQNELKTSNAGEVSTTSTNGATSILPGGAYGFYPRLRSSSSSGTGYWGSNAVADTNYVAYGFGTSYVTSIRIYTSSGSTAYAQQTYVTASPPYDLGDGEAPFFIFANVDSQGNIVSVYSADTPPWIYNGPTKVTADRHAKDGKQYIKHKNFSMPAPIKSNSSMAQKVAYKKAVLEAKRSAVEEEIELTPLMKNADMDLIPHPFEASPDFTPILLDPMSKTTIDLMELCDNGNGESVNEIIHDNYINVGNTPLARSGPAGLMIVDAKWK